MKEIPSHSVERVLNSSALKVINLMIDNDLKYVQYIMSSLPGLLEQRKDRSFAFTPKVRTRVSYEVKNTDPAQGEVEIPYEARDLKQLQEAIGEALGRIARIDEMQRLKLRLFNDYDFTHGDPEDQIAVFGPVPADSWGE